MLPVPSFKDPRRTPRRMCRREAAAAAPERGPRLWGLMTLDTERGIIFMPVGNPGGSFYGGDRPGDNLYSATILALDAATGKYKWHFQTTHHDLFDADLSAAPSLVEVVQNGR